MNRGLVLDMAAVQRLNWNIPVAPEWLDLARRGPDVSGIRQVEHAGFLYLLGAGQESSESLLIIARQGGEDFFGTLSPQDRIECFLRILKVALSKIDRGVKIPTDWRGFHSGSLLSFQSNRWSTNIKSRVYVDFSPADSIHTFAFALVVDERVPLARVSYDEDLVTEAVIGYDSVGGVTPELGLSELSSMALTTKFVSGDIAHGLPFSVWRDSKLTKEQLAFFNASFSGSLRLRGAAGTGKTLVLCLRFLKEIYAAEDAGSPIRAVFVTHGQETADNIRAYLAMMDERGVLPQLNATGAVEVTTLHGLANELVNYDVDEVQPVSFDGADGRRMQMELLDTIVREIAASLSEEDVKLDSEFFRGLTSDAETAEAVGFRCDLNDEFSSVLEAYGVREVDAIADHYLRAPFNSRLLAKSIEERGYVLAAYRRFRQLLSDLGVVSLDQFISDFGAYLNSFRWSAVRSRKGYDVVFADELHLFNKHERRVLGYLLRGEVGVCRIAVAYDPRQSPRNSFLPHDTITKDAVWTEANLSVAGQRFELTDVFRYTPEILKLLQSLNRWFPAEDLSEEWGLNFGASMLAAGELPNARLYRNQIEMANDVAESARRLGRRSSAGRVAVLVLDPDRFDVYRKSGVFSQGFVAVAARDEIDLLNRFAKRVVISMPEYVAGLQFEHVFLVDANAGLVAKLGGGPAGLQKFISGVYLGASRAESTLTICADAEAGGFAEPIRDALATGLVLSHVK